MVVQVGVMELPVTEDPDDIQTYMNGEHASGGLWTALTRSSNHDHSGGLNGVQLGATSIPDGSITSAKLDPSVLGPYALVDGSKPFTGQVTLNADAIVRDRLFFGAKPAGVADATLSRTGPGAMRADTHLGVGVNPAAWHTARRALQPGLATALAGNADTRGGRLMDNSYLDTGAAYRALLAAPAVAIDLNSDAPGEIRLLTAPSVAAGAAQTFTTRMALAPTGTLTLTPDAGQPALSINGTLQNPTGTLYLYSGAGTAVVCPVTSGNHYLGVGSNKWYEVHAQNGAINTSSAVVKEAITPLSQTECYEAAKAVTWYSFRYLPPAYQEPPEQEGQEPEERQRQVDEGKAAHAKMLAETAPARHQRGFVFPDTEGVAKDEAGGTLPPVPDLFGLEDRQSTTPQADLATLGCALQEVIRRLESLEAA